MFLNVRTYLLNQLLDNLHLEINLQAFKGDTSLPAWMEELQMSEVEGSVCEVEVRGALVSEDILATVIGFTFTLLLTIFQFSVTV